MGLNSLGVYSELPIIHEPEAEIPYANPNTRFFTILASGVFSELQVQGQLI
jgi:hypothetical protein